MYATTIELDKLEIDIPAEMILEMMKKVISEKMNKAGHFFKPFEMVISDVCLLDSYEYICETTQG
jgi:hypothetical protein